MAVAADPIPTERRAGSSCAVGSTRTSTSTRTSSPRRVDDVTLTGLFRVARGLAGLPA